MGNIESNLPFQAVFTGEQVEPDELDQRRAATAFSELTDQLLLEHFVKAAKGSFESPRGVRVDYVRLGIGVKKADRLYGVGVIATSVADKEVRQLCVTDVSSDKTGNAWTYFQCNKEPVRRTDTLEPVSHQKKLCLMAALLRAVGIELEPVVIDEVLDNGESEVLERQLRVNDQPVGYDEIDGLRKFVSAGQAVETSKTP